MSPPGIRRAASAALILAAAVAHASVGRAVANDLDRDEEIVFFPTYVVQSDQPTIVLPIQAWIYEPETKSLARNLTLKALCELIGLDEADRQTPIFTSRARTFLVDNERDQKITVKLLNRDVELSASEEDGQIRSLLTVPSDRVRAAATSSGRAVPTLSYRAVTTGSDRRIFTGRIHLIPPKGISVVSDIDDTIKVSDVLNKQELLKNTFVREFRAVDGMAKTYDGWADAGAAFHYVSGSPRQLYADLDAFRAKSGFPAGSFHLRRLRWKDLGSIREFVSAPEAYKIGTIETIMKACPERKFVLVGDSGERDPEVYGELTRRRPEQVALVAIRNITDATLVDARMTAAFRGIPADRLLLFRDAAELPSALLPPAAK